MRQDHILFRTKTTCLGATLTALCAAATTTGAQWNYSFSATPGAGGNSAASTITHEEVEIYVELLELDQAQQSYLWTLFDVYTTDRRAAQREMQEAMQKQFGDAQVIETEDGGRIASVVRTLEGHEDNSDDVGGTTLNAINTFADQAAAVADTFFKDLRDGLTEAQDEFWPRVERLRLRSQNIRRSNRWGSAIGEVDLIEILRELDAAPELLYGDATERYEIALDRLLKERADAEKTIRESLTAGLNGGGALGDLQNPINQQMELDSAIFEETVRQAKFIANQLPEQTAETFNQRVLAGLFPRIYGDTAVLDMLDTAQKMDDLTLEQTERLAALRRFYERDLRAVNKEWEDRIREDPKGASSSSAGVTVSRVHFGDGGGFAVDDQAQEGREQSPLDAARIARQELDNETEDRLRDILTVAQADQLPERRRGLGGGLGGSMPFSTGVIQNIGEGDAVNVQVIRP